MPARIGFDTETWLIQPGLLAPPLVCGSFHVPDTDSIEPTWLHLRDEALAEIATMLTTDCHILVQNGAFDFGVVCNERPDLLPLVFQAYEDGRIRDCRVRDKLILLARGEMKTDEDGRKSGFSLAEIVQRRFGIDLSGDKTNPDAWRLRYRELDGVPLEAWPEEAVRYAKDDAVWNVRIFDHQAAECELDDPLDWLPNEREQTLAAWNLHLMGMWGIRTDHGAVLKLDAHLRTVVAEAEAKLKASRILKGKEIKRRATGLIEVEWSKDTARIKAKVEEGFARQGLPVPRTAPSSRFPDGQTKTDAETLIASGDPDLKVLADVAEDEKLLTTYVPALLAGATAPICPGWNELVESGRTSCRKPNLQNPPKKGGVRECFIPRPGSLFLATDYSTVELCTWAQVCLDLLGYSDMAEAIRAGRDLHVDMAVDILRAAGESTDYDDLNRRRKQGDPHAKEARQLAKAANFGLPGGLGAETFIAYAWATYQVRIEIDRAKRIKDLWLAKWREAKPYFNHISSLGGEFGESFPIVQLRSGRVRGGCTFTSAANSFFQGLAADGAKEALRRISRECYLGGGPLEGCRPVAFLHDEFILEVPDDVDLAHAANLRLMQHMVEGMKVYVPDVPIKAEPSLMRRWFKEAEPVYDEKGRLRVWEPKEKTS
jgi:hypothetical protein